MTIIGRPIAWLVVVTLAVVSGLSWYWGRTAAPLSTQVTELVSTTAASLPAPAIALSAAPGSAAPSFDIVRVGPSGSAVLAGRAEPGAQVTIRDGGALIGQSTADVRGEWVIVPTAAIEPGGRNLALTARGVGGEDVAAAETLMIIVPSRPAAMTSGPPPSEAVMALALPVVGPARVIQAPAGALALQIVDYDDRGAIRFAGAAPPRAKLRLYVDNALAGAAVADSAGRWTLTPTTVISEGVHTLRLDQLGDAGVYARVELPFQRDPAPARAQTVGTPIGTQPMVTQATLTRVVVQPGQTLWRLARMAYGEGTRYTLIYSANQGQIRDPNMIYPGQAFALPAK